MGQSGDGKQNILWGWPNATDQSAHALPANCFCPQENSTTRIMRIFKPYIRSNVSAIKGT